MDAKEYYRSGKHSVWRASKMRQFLLKEIVRNQLDGGRILEFGCGRGENLEVLKSLGYDIVGIEINEEECKHAIKKVGFVICGDESKMTTFPENYFDISFTIGVMDHLNFDDFMRAYSYIKTITKNIVFCLETNNEAGPYYYPHSYDVLGFRKVIEFHNNDGDKSLYTLWRLDC